MLHSAKELEDISRREEGDLRQVPFPVLLLALALHERTVVLEIRRRQLKKAIVIEYGDPVDCNSNLVHETLGRFMVAQGKLTSEVQDSCFREAVTRGVQLGDVLRERGLVDPSGLFRIMQQNLARKLLDGFSWSDGDFFIRRELPEVESPLKVRVSQLVLTGVSKFAPQEEVNAGVWPLVSRPLGLHPAPLFPIKDIKLTASQERLKDLLRQPRTMKELAEGSGIPFDEVTRLIYAFAIIGAVAPADELPAAQVAPEPDQARAVEAETRRSPEPVSSGSGLNGKQIEELQNQVMEAYLAHRKQDAFDLLALPEDATVAAIRESYLTFAHRYAPWRYYHDPQLLSIAEKANDLFLAGARAFGELMDSEQRNTLLYRRKVLAEEKAKKPAADQFAIQTDLLDADKQYRKGKAFLEAGNYKEAYQLLEFASDCDPQNGVYRAEVVHCDYLTSPETRAEKALTAYDEILRMDPKCGIAAFYAGELHRLHGDRGQAETYLRRANQLMAPDRRPIEALKALSRGKKPKH